jgi:hypothetical protein
LESWKALKVGLYREAIAMPAVMRSWTAVRRKVLVRME